MSITAGCSDDGPVTPPAPVSAWQEVDLGTPYADSRLQVVGINGDHGWAGGWGRVHGADQAPGPFFFRMQPDGSWVQDPFGELPALAGFLPRGLAVEPDGGIVLAGLDFGNIALPCMVYDARGDLHFSVARAGFGLWTLDGGGTFMVAGGSSRGGTLWTSAAPGQWPADDLPLTGSNDSGFRDVHVVGDRAVACGFDDGADTLQVILTRTAGTGWSKVDLAGSGLNLDTLQAVAMTDGGAIFVGGIEAAGGREAQAFLSLRDAAGEWTAIVLPEPVALGGINDILIAGDGSIYLACSGEPGLDPDATIIHATESGVVRELPPFPGQMLQLAEAPGGTIYAVGVRHGVGEGTAVMFRRAP
ncbi:MAG: hypothetical protein IH621_12100 [Krumholzibacteria bacterium]|nr:hypothetical protein [Candidatus Krumholzibacteria bacterium]